MIRRIGKRKYNIYSFDIESHNDDESIKLQQTSAWLLCFIDENSKIEDESNYFYSMIDFLKYLKDISSKKRKNKNDPRPCNNYAIYIYNLSFEWSFMLPVLINDFGFKFKEKIEKNDEFVFNSVSTKTCSSVWTCSFKFDKNSGTIKLIDLAKIYGGGLKKVAKSFNLETQKGEIDYRKNRLHDYVVTNEEKEYIFKDCRIIIEILQKVKDDKTFFNSISMASYSVKTMLKEMYPRIKKPYNKFREEYPLLDNNQNAFLRLGVSGGICYCNKRFQFKELNYKILHIDAHQMHPSSAYLNLFPYGSGEYFKGKPTKFFGYINCLHIKISYDDVKLHSIVQLIGIDGIEDKELVVWDFQIKTMKKCYVNLKIEYIDGYCYHAKFLTFRDYFYNNFKKRKKAKEEGNSYNELRFKLLNNSFYGKLLERFHSKIFENIIDKDGIINSIVIDKEKDGETIEENARYTYIPVGSCIPAYSSCCLIETALKFGYENIIYFDTDSIFCVYNEKTKKVWDSLNQKYELGGWGLEHIIDKSQLTAPKRYKLECNGETILKCGGINFERLVSYDELNITSSSWKVQRAYRCKGGTLIDFQKKEMKVQKKYEEIYKHNTQSDLAK